MIIFIKKIKTKEGINSFDTEKIKKDIPEGYSISVNEPIITLTAHHVILAYKCEQKITAQPKSKSKAKDKVKTKSKKIAVSKV